MSKIFLKIYLKFVLKCFNSIVVGFYCCVVMKQMNSNKHYITASCIPCNTYFYSYVIIVIIYQVYPKFKHLTSHFQCQPRAPLTTHFSILFSYLPLSLSCLSLDLCHRQVGRVLSKRTMWQGCKR